jgi:hypothetical protein
VRKNLSIAGLLLAWLCANGALLDGLQVFAWGRMFAGYAGSMSVGAALRETFNPQKRCELCVTVAAAKSTTEASAPAQIERTAQRIDLVCDEPEAIVFAAVVRDWPAALASVAPERVDAVDVPPPRV